MILKKYYLAAPIIVAVILGVYALTPKVSDLSDEVTKQMLIQDGSPMLGNPSASITIVEWGDYQCTFCYKFHMTKREIIMKEYISTEKANFVFKDFPLNGPDSVLAAEASYCADDQGKYWEYHDILYNNWAGEQTGWVNRDSLHQFAQTVGLDVVQFNECLDMKKYEAKVLANEEFAHQIGINATPSFFIFNEEQLVKIRGNQPLDVFFRVLDEI